MDDAAVVRERRRVARLHEDLQELGEADGLEPRVAEAIEGLFERSPLDEPHAEEPLAAAVDPELVDRHDVGVLELPHDPGLFARTG